MPERDLLVLTTLLLCAEQLVSLGVFLSSTHSRLEFKNITNHDLFEEISYIFGSRLAERGLGNGSGELGKAQHVSNRKKRWMKKNQFFLSLFSSPLWSSLVLPTHLTYHNQVNSYIKSAFHNTLSPISKFFLDSFIITVYNYGYSWTMEAFRTLWPKCINSDTLWEETCDWYQYLVITDRAIDHSWRSDSHQRWLREVHLIQTLQIDVLSHQAIDCFWWSDTRNEKENAWSAQKAL